MNNSRCGATVDAPTLMRLSARAGARTQDVDLALFPLACVEQAVEVVEIGRVAAYAGHVPAIQYTPAQHCCPCRLDCSIKNVFESGHYTGFLIRSFEPTRAR